MKTIVATVLVAVGSVGVANSQQIPVEIDDLRAPTSPAFVLLDVTPAAIERPENPKSFSVNLINTISRSKGLPQNYALEVAPYWLMSHPDLTFQEYQSPGARSLIQTLAISVATTPMAPPEGLAADPAGTRVGIGLRTNLSNGRFDPKLNELVSELGEIQGRVLDTDEALTAAEEAVKEAEDALAAATKAGQKTEEAEKALKARLDERAKLQGQMSAVENDSMTKSLEIQAMDAQRLGLIVTLAAGKTWDFPADDFAQRDPGRWGVWLTPTYRFRACAASTSECTAALDAIAVVRALREPGKETSWDVGGRMMWQPTRELRLSAEVLRRRAGEGAGVGTTSSNRTSGMLEYQIRDDLSVYGSFGRDFKNDTGQEPLVSLMGLNVGLGKKPSVRPVTNAQ